MYSSSSLNTGFEGRAGRSDQTRSTRLSGKGTRTELVESADKDFERDWYSENGSTVGSIPILEDLGNSFRS